MENKLFRQESIDRISSPEELHDYMRVTSPRIWMILTAVLLLLVGFIVYASTATMENTLPVRVQLNTYHLDADPDAGLPDEGDYTSVTAEVPLEKMEHLKTGMKVRFMKEEGKIYSLITDGENKTATIIFEMDHNPLRIPDGEYDAELVLESTSPISFLWN